MMPTSVAFTGLEIEPDELTFYRRHDGPIPQLWTVVEVDMAKYPDRNTIIWLMENVSKKFNIQVGFPTGFIGFECEVDAVMFRLKGGDALFSEN